MSILSFFNCNAQNEKIKLSKIINDIYFSEKGLNIKDQPQQMIFLISHQQEIKNPKLNNFIFLDSYNDKKFEFIYSNEEVKIKKRLKALKKQQGFEYANVVRIQIVDYNTDFIKLYLDIGMTDYKFFKQNSFKFTFKGDSWNVYCKSTDNNWVIDHIDSI